MLKTILKELFYRSTVSAVDQFCEWILKNGVVCFRGLSDWFGTREITPYGYILDSNSTFTLLNTRIPVIISDKNYICGRRIILGASGISIATQIIANLLLGAENGASSVETPRFQIINRDIIGIESKYSRNLPYLHILGYVKTLTKATAILI